MCAQRELVRSAGSSGTLVPKHQSKRSAHISETMPWQPQCLIRLSSLRCAYEGIELKQYGDISD